jgi:TolB-like protein
MASALEPHLHLEVGHILFLDIVGFSRLLADEQKELVQELNQIVRETKQFQAAEAEGKLTRLPTGDGMVLVFTNNPEAPIECALEISKALQNYPKLKLRMGIHSGPVNPFADVNDQSNLAGAGINVAQRVVGCGDAGHILLSKHFAEDLEQYVQWRSHPHDIGRVEVKHGARISVVNFYTDQLGNSALPAKLRQARTVFRLKSAAVAALLLIAVLGVGFWTLRRSQGKFQSEGAPISSKSIAVLPFQNLSAEKDNAFFAEGVQDEILTDLAKIADLKVISRTSVMPYKSENARNIRQIAQELGVAHIVEGTVQRAGERVRVSAQLIDARTDAHLWAEHYDRPIIDVFAIQSEVARSIADELQAKISPTEKIAINTPPTKDVAAYDLYLRAQALFADASDPRANLAQAAELLEQAVARDQHFLLAWCLLSRVHGVAYFRGHDHTSHRLELAKAALDAALKIQSDSGEAHLALANYYYMAFRDYERSKIELSIAKRSLPNNSEVLLYSAFIDRREGRWVEATRNMERALEIDPRNFFVAHQLAINYLLQRRYREEAETYDRALAIVPGDPVTRILRAVIALNSRADLMPFQTTLAQLIAENPTVAKKTDIDSLDYAFCERTEAATARALANYPAQGAVFHGVNYPHAYWDGAVALWNGDDAKASAAFTAARDDVERALKAQPDFAAALSLLGKIDAGLGRKNQAIAEGRRACELLPMSKDAVDGVSLAIDLAQIYAFTGEKDLAIEQIAMIENVPNALSYGLLKLHPYWDSLRGDPRFEKIVEEAKKPVALK